MNNKETLCPIILAGGGGTRLWPLSREHYPKQFLAFNNEHSMLQQSLLRICGINTGLTVLSPMLICNEEHRFLVAEHARLLNINPFEIILEPTGRNTAPALTMAALRAPAGDPVLLMLPADHLIENTDAFQQSVIKGMAEAMAGKLVTFGIKPKTAETGYGYLHVQQSDNDYVFNVHRFVEKPDIKTAEKYVQDGTYYWNSGIFMMKASVWLKAINEFRPDIAETCGEVNRHSRTDGNFIHLDKTFANCPAESIDYAIMENACGKNSHYQTSMIVLDAGWSDLGSWSALWEASVKDDDSNVIHGDVITSNTRSSIIQSHSRLVATVGCDNLLVIETADAVLVGNRDQSQNVKQIVEKLKLTSRGERINHRKVFRPWGSYESLDSGERFQVKRLMVNPGKKLSLQLHHKRAEHWVVVHGKATVTCADKVFDLQENESTYIPLGAKHRLENRQSIPLEVIEVQSGHYLGEDDIVRFDDDFGRHK